MEANSDVGYNLVKVATVYLVIGLFWGMYMAISHEHALATVHSHITLLGWVTMAIAGLVYIVRPACANSRLARPHYWLHNIGLPIMMASLALFLDGNEQAEKFIGVGSILVLLSLLIFTVNVFANIKKEA